MTPAARRLIALMLIDVRRLMRSLASGAQSVAEWGAAFDAALAKYHTAAQLVGQNGAALSDAAMRALTQTVQAQIGFRERWAVEIQDAAEFKLGWNARAALYAQGIGQSYWRGATKMLPLPAMPRDGTSQCLGNCTCFIEIEWIDEENGDADAYWRLGATERHCQTCPQRARDWAPLRIRGGVLQ